MSLQDGAPRLQAMRPPTHEREDKRMARAVRPAGGPLPLGNA